MRQAHASVAGSGMPGMFGVVLVMASMFTGCAGGCAGGGRGWGVGGLSATSERDQELRNRATALKRTSDTLWESIGLALDRGEAVHPMHVYRAGQLRASAMGVALRSTLLPLEPRAEQAKAEKAIKELEEILPAFMSLPRDQPPGGRSTLLQDGWK